MLSKYFKYKQKYLSLIKGGAALAQVPDKTVPNDEIPRVQSNAMEVEASQEEAQIVPFKVSKRDMEEFGLNSCCLNYLTFAKKMVNDLFESEKLIFQRFLGKGGVGLAIEFLTPEGKKIAIKGIFIRLDIARTLKEILKCLDI